MLAPFVRMPLARAFQASSRQGATLPLYWRRAYSSQGPVTKYTSSHEWVKIDKNVATIGVTQYAQKLLGDVVFVELPELEKQVERSEPVSTVESVKAASDIYAPADGTIVEANELLSEQPGLINKSPENDGWIFKMSLESDSKFEDLMNEEQYQDFCTKE
ncbi:hypothetical protein IWQ62_002827 [Dispira parvispora]|uniref:Glycine cleavage system H protein n=1 Tax=Dispira parvispora TaxID=1520584 RepID=A0A9W8AVY6_9FUNG|nr:hypothetical protein IWQ62_002827 [Dispira parvispora]